MKCTSVLLSLVILAAVGCSSKPTRDPALEAKALENASAAEKVLVGHWYAEAPLSGSGTQRWLIERRSDGLYRMVTRIYSARPTKEQVEVGEWGIQDGNYLSVTKGWIEGDQLIPVPENDPNAKKSYRLIYLDRDRFEYRSNRTGDQFKMKRVDPGFRLP